MRSRRLPLVLLYAALLLGALLSMLPLFWMVSASLMPAGDANSFPPHLLPRRVTFEHYRSIFTRLDMGRYLYHPQYGLLNYVIGALGGPRIDWLGDPRWAMPAIILLAVWKNFGYNMLIFIAGLQAIPEELYEAAHLDGASAVQRFRHVTVPMLGPTLLFVSVITMIGYFQLFAEPYVMTQGGPLRATTSVVLLMYEEGFRWWRMGHAAAIAFVLFLVILAATLIQFRIQRARET